MSSSKVPITRLPLPESSRILTHYLTPDPIASSSSSFVQLLKTQPSSIRKSRAADASAHFSYVTPLPLAFPYRIPAPPDDITQQERSLYIEKVLTTQEPLSEVENSHTSHEGPKLYQSLERDLEKVELLSLAPICLEDCLPLLAVGDSLRIAMDKSQSDEAPTDNSPDSVTRKTLVDVLSGRCALMSIPEGTNDSRGYAPWSLRYSGHQFGSWAGQLGDGRAVSICCRAVETSLPSDPSTTYELQLKGAGRTPFSRGADGLAVLRSSVREYLVAEGKLPFCALDSQLNSMHYDVAMQALRIPTTRSLSLISLPSLSVARESMETAAIVCRVAPSFIRIGNFQALNSDMPETAYMFMGGGGGSFAQQPPHYEGLRVLGEWVTRSVLKLGLRPDEPWGKALLWECAKRNAMMVAGWQAQGFMHGVMNTDNISIMGLTIDYGPYAFMDVFSRDHICNHTDETGRYSYKFQPTMIVYALRMLLRSLAPLIGAEMESEKAVAVGWAHDAPKTKLAKWIDEAQKALNNDLETYIMETFTEEYWRLMRGRLGLKTSVESDHREIFEPLLDLLEKYKMDFHASFRHLTTFRVNWLASAGDEAEEKTLDSDPLHSFLQRLLPADIIDAKSATLDWLAFLQTYSERFNSSSEHSAWAVVASEPGGWADARERDMKQHNPRFILRQWVLEELIVALQNDAEAVAEGKRKVEDTSKARNALNKMLVMATRPFDAWGAEGSSPMTEEEQEESRLCGTGPKDLMGFQCSCSS